MKVSDMREVKDNLYEISRNYKKGMNVPARIYGTRELIDSMDNAVVEQITNVAALPGILKYALCMADGHSGYGFPIGGVAAIDPESGVISPGGIGFDINCGVRLISTSLTLDEVKPVMGELVDKLFRNIPSGVGSGGVVTLEGSNLDEALMTGARWAVKNGYGVERDCEYTEEGGCIAGADHSFVSSKARKRGAGQAGSLGSGNHYIEVQVARKNNIYDREAAEIFGIDRDDQIMIMIHSGSRGFGHQIATDYLHDFASLQKRFGYSLPDRELSCAPFYSDEGQAYFKAMNCAVNMAFLNRQLMLHRIREVFHDVFGKRREPLNINMVYDVCHNTAKLENHIINGAGQKVLIHRKGATRAFPPGSPDIPEKYREQGRGARADRVRSFAAYEIFSF